MEIGTLNQRIAFLEHSTKIDGIGNHKARWEEAFSCWAAVSVKTSTETSEAGVTQEVVSLESLTRSIISKRRQLQGSFLKAA
jgi:head-tail adaptor